MNLNSETLLEAIGEIDDTLVEEAIPKKMLTKKSIPWTRYGSIAAGLCLCILSLWMLQVFVGNSTQKETSMSAPEYEEEDCVETEAEVEAEAETEPPAAGEYRPSAEDEVCTEEELSDVQSESLPSIGIAYSVTLNGRIYFPISFEERKQYALIPENATGLTPENTYQITETDLGETMGTVTYSEDTSLIGATAYHYAKYPDSDDICILNIKGHYEFYIGVNN